MSNLEHYFENLLLQGKDVSGGANRNTLSEDARNAVEICADYVIWDIFHGRENFLLYIKRGC